MKSVLNHMAILVESIESVLEKNLFSFHTLGKVEKFPSEGTRELYIGKDGQMGRLLLIEAIGEGPYQTTLIKRGTGLHHIALDVLSIDEYVRNLARSGWLLHPKSLEFYNSHKQVYLCRPNVPVLIEVQERKEFNDNAYFINKLEFPFAESRLLDNLECNSLKLGNEIGMRIENKFMLVKDLLGKK